jgi:hypothetical protein
VGNAATGKNSNGMAVAQPALCGEARIHLGFRCLASGCESYRQEIVGGFRAWHKHICQYLVSGLTLVASQVRVMTIHNTIRMIAMKSTGPVFGRQVQFAFIIHHVQLQQPDGGVEKVFAAQPRFSGAGNKFLELALAPILSMVWMTAR